MVYRFVILAALAQVGLAQVAAPTSSRPPTIRTETTLVLVPTLVRTEAGEPVFNLQEKDFRLTDNGVRQAVRVDEVEGQAMNVVVLLQTGGAAQRQFSNFARLGTVVDAMLGKAAGRVALVTFDSRPEELWSFPERREGIEDAIAHPQPGDDGAAILNAVNYAMDVFDEEKAIGRRVILLISQPQDAGSTVPAETVLRRLGESNTVVYAATFSPEKAWARDQFRTYGKRGGYADGVNQASNSHSFDLKEPLMQAIRAIRKDSPAELAMLSGGEHVRVDGRRDLEAKLMAMANELPNSYVLSFRPTRPTAGLHMLKVDIPGHVGTMQVASRGSYWAADGPERLP